MTAESRTISPTVCKISWWCCCSPHFLPSRECGLKSVGRRLPELDHLYRYYYCGFRGKIWREFAGRAYGGFELARRIGPGNPYEHARLDGTYCAQYRVGPGGNLPTLFAMLVIMALV